MEEGIASALLKQGYADLVKIRKGDKRPAEQGWREKRPALPDVHSWDRTGHSVGVQTTRFPALDLDIEDRKLAVRVRALALKHLGRAAVRGRGNSPKELLVYRTDTPFPKMTAKLARDGKKYTIEVLGQGQQFVAYGIHPSGEQYVWKTAPLHTIPPDKLTAIDEEKVTEFFSRLADLLEGWTVLVGEETGPEPVKAGPIEAGARNTTMASLAGTMRARNMSKGAAYAALKAENAARCVPPLEDPEIRTILNSVWRYAPAEDIEVRPAEDEFEADHLAEVGTSAPPHLSALRELNEKYAVVQVGSDVLVMQEDGTGNPPLLSFTAFRNKYLHRPHSPPEAKKAVPLSQGWLEWPGRRQYTRLVFKPGKEARDDEYNLWRGWATQPREGDKHLPFLEHLREAVCSGNSAHYEWLLDWMAHLFQFPAEKPGTAVALRGKQGAGKTIVGGALVHLLGDSAYVVADSHAVTGHFNAHLANNLFLLCEEAFWAGSKAGTSSLKHLVTGSELSIERKGIDAEMMPNYTRLMITSNESWVWPADLDDRRLTIFHVSGENVGDTDYFQRIMRGLKRQGGYGHLLHFLLSREIDAKRLRYAPKTAALATQALHSMDTKEEWLHNLLVDGEIEGELLEDGRVRTYIATLYDSYLASVPPGTRAESNVAFGIFLGERLRFEKGSREHVGHWSTSQRSWVYILAPLKECRAFYSSMGRAAPEEWPEPDTWTVIDPMGEVQNAAD